jgi:hypothetical protein
VPALWSGGVHPLPAEVLSPRASALVPLQELKAAAPGAPDRFVLPGGKTPSQPRPLQVTVAQNSSETSINLGSVFAAHGGLEQGDGLQLSVLGNTNSGLVTTDLSEAMLTLTYKGGKYGTATITVCATDGDGVSVQQTFLVTVTPLTPVVNR